MDSKRNNLIALGVMVALVATALLMVFPWRSADRLTYALPDPDNPGEYEQVAYELTQDTVTLGSDADLSLPDTSTPSVAATVERSPGEDDRSGATDWVVTAMEPGTTPVYVNGVAVDEARLVGGDYIRIGADTVQLSAGSTSITQGLDIKGGLSIILRAVPNQGQELTEDGMQRVETIMTKRVNALGVSEATVQRQGADSLLVQLPGIADQAGAERAIGRTALLEFVDVSSITDTSTLAAITSGAYLAEGAPPVKLLSGTYDAFLTGEVVTRAQASLDPQTGAAEVLLDFDAEGTRVWGEVSTRLAGVGQIAIVLDGELQSAPFVRDAITDGTTRITGSFSVDEAKDLAAVLQAGALPYTLEKLESRSVDATLGQASLQQGLLAGLVGLALVAIFMGIYYRGLGAISWFSLALFATLFLGILAMLSKIGAFALTLPGIAGIVLTVGLAADSSILMFERFKEEVRMGKTYRTAAKSGTRHAIGTSLDADLVTFVSALVLWLVAIGPVKGFAFTLMLGIFCDLTVAILFTRSVIVLLAETVVPKVPFLFGMKGGDRDA